MKMRVSVRTGEECPGGIEVFQTTFFWGENSVGKVLPSATPAPLGPRNCDQSGGQCEGQQWNYGIMRHGDC